MTSGCALRIKNIQASNAPSHSSLMDKPSNMSKQKQAPRGKVRFHENELVRPAA